MNVFCVVFYLVVDLIILLFFLVNILLKDIDKKNSIETFAILFIAHVEEPLYFR